MIQSAGGHKIIPGCAGNKTNTASILAATFWEAQKLEKLQSERLAGSHDVESHSNHSFALVFGDAFLPIMHAEFRSRSQLRVSLVPKAPSPQLGVKAR